MTDTIERTVTINSEQELYVIAHDSSTSALGFDVCLDRTKRMLLELIGRGAISDAEERRWAKRARKLRGTVAGYDHYRMIQEALHKWCENQDERAVYDLSPQLTGLEGWRVEVVDNHGETRRFIVGRSTGWAPCHLEIPRRNSSGGAAASLEYRSVKQIERVR